MCLAMVEVAWGKARTAGRHPSYWETEQHWFVPGSDENQQLCKLNLNNISLFKDEPSHKVEPKTISTDCGTEEHMYGLARRSGQLGKGGKQQMAKKELREKVQRKKWDAKGRKPLLSAPRWKGPRVLQGNFKMPLETAKRYRLIWGSPMES